MASHIRQFPPLRTPKLTEEGKARYNRIVMPSLTNFREAYAKLKAAENNPEYLRLCKDIHDAQRTFNNASAELEQAQNDAWDSL